MDVILETPGTRIGKKQEMLKISVPDQDVVEVPLRVVESVIVGSGVQITSQALQSLSSHAVNIVYTSLGKPYGLYTPFANVGTVYTRRQQLLAYEDWRGCHLATQFVYATIENKRRLLLYFAKNRKQSNPKKYYILRAATRFLGKMLGILLTFSKQDVKGKKVYNVRRNLMGIEGRATATYFREYGNLFPKEFKTMTRTRRPPRDPVNSLLSLGYTVLQGHISTAIASAGLELYGGFLHSDRSGKPSLALDLLEEFRQPIVDRLVARLIQKGQFNLNDFEESIHGYRIKQEKKSFFYTELRREILGGSKSNELFGADNDKSQKGRDKNVKVNYKRGMIRQARKLANYLIGESSNYEPFLMNW
ncbi:MAG: CRISPR-associated endonuclease Cas1 [Promethearchaeota archaeon]